MSVCNSFECVMDILIQLQKDEEFRLSFIKDHPRRFRILADLDFPFVSTIAATTIHLSYWIEMITYEYLEQVFNLPFIA